jgi:hypothetical protein
LMLVYLAHNLMRRLKNSPNLTAGMLSATSVLSDGKCSSLWYLQLNGVVVIHHSLHL